MKIFFFKSKKKSLNVIEMQMKEPEVQIDGKDNKVNPET